MILLKWYSIIVLILIETMLIYKVYFNITTKDDFKYNLIAFIMMLPILYLALSFEV